MLPFFDAHPKWCVLEERLPCDSEQALKSWGRNSLGLLGVVTEPRTWRTLSELIHQKWQLVKIINKTWRWNKPEGRQRLMSVDRQSLQVCICKRYRGRFEEFTTRCQTWRNIGLTGKKTAFCIIDFTRSTWYVCCDGIMDISYKIPNRSTYRQSNSCMVHQISADWLSVYCQLNSQDGAVSLCRDHLPRHLRSQQITWAGHCKCLNQWCLPQLGCKILQGLWINL